MEDTVFILLNGCIININHIILVSDVEIIEGKSAISQDGVHDIQTETYDVIVVTTAGMQHHRFDQRDKAKSFRKNLESALSVHRGMIKDPTFSSTINGVLK